MKKEEWFLHTPIAHRGITNIKKGITENSIEAAKLCIKYNIPMEIDVRMTKEKELILLHNNEVLFDTGIKKHYYDITKNDIKNYKIKNSKCKIATLDELLKVIDGKIPLLIEPKIITNNKKMELFINKLEKTLNSYNGKYIIHSFHFNIYKLYKNKSIKKGIILPLLEQFPKCIQNFTNKLIITNKKFDFISFNIEKLNKKPIKYLTKIKKPILLWTVDINKYYRFVKNIDCNLIIKLDELDLEYLE